MFRRATQRSRTILLVVLALLFSQLALAAYVCPAASGRGPAVMEMAPGEPCEGMADDQEQPVLCHQHCDAAPQACDPAKVPAASLPAVVHEVVLPLSFAVAQAQGAVAEDTQAQPPPEPVFLSTLRLRV